MKPTWRLPQGVPSDQANFLRKRRYLEFRWIFKYAKRKLIAFIALKQFGSVPEETQIKENHRNILWINFSAPSLGDSIMDLASRVLLKNKKIILLTHTKNISLYRRDEYFFDAYSEAQELKKYYPADFFDLVICDSFAPRVILQKLKVAPRVSFLSLYGFVNGFEIHRTKYSFMRMKELLRSDDFQFPIRPSIVFSHRDARAEGFDVCIAVGGEWEFRTYSHWLEVIEGILTLDYSVTLVGSSNGATVASQICSRFPQVHSTVGLLSLKDVASWIARAQYFIGADGGLWHIACSIPIPTVVLFADCELFDDSGNRVTRESEDMECETLYHHTEVSWISPYDVLDAFERLRSRTKRLS